MIDPAADLALHERRAALAPRPAPKARLDYGVRLDQSIGTGEDGQLTLLFVPDKFTLDSAALANYLAALETSAAEAESLALTVLEDVVNELVCRWVQVNVTLAGKTVTVEDRQPGWANDGLLARI